MRDYKAIAINSVYSVKFLKYVFGAAFFAWLDVALLYVFTHYFWIYHIYSSALSFTISLVLWFIYQKYVTFGDKTGQTMFKFMKFLSFQIAAYFIYVWILRLGVDYLGLHLLFVALGAKGVTFMRNFFLNHFFNFNH